uniref:Lipopolysaccharide heptosyltransferase 1 n=1 Tax=Desulfobacca acetoxidans TaxID=60893 RepID=A0A7C5EM60_9BACT
MAVTLAEPRLLLVKLSSLGDVIHALPTLEALRTLYPHGEITWLVEAGNAPLLERHPALDQVWPVPRLRWRGNDFLEGMGSLLRIARHLRGQTFDLVIDLQGLLKSAVWVALAKSPRKLGFDRTRELSYLPLTEKLPPYDPEEHAVWRYLRVARHLGAPPATPRFRLGFTFPENLSHLWPEREVRPLAILHPGARWSSKLWPAASWARLAEWLAEERGFQVAVSGSAADRHLAEEIISRSQTPLLNLAGRTSLPELAALLKKARLAVTTDTGPMHLAVALGTPVVAIFGPTAPWRTGPFGQNHEVVRLSYPCSPCFKRRCPKPRCLTDLPPSSVRQAVEKLLLRQEIP